jgi:hypothetical protein
MQANDDRRLGLVGFRAILEWSEDLLGVVVVAASARFKIEFNSL